MRVAHHCRGTLHRMYQPNVVRSSIESTHKSLEAILGIREVELKGIFGSVDVYAACEQDRKSLTRPTDFLLSYVQKQKSCKTHFDATYWFQAIYGLTQLIHNPKFS